MGNGRKGRDAKVMARTLRDALRANAIKITHSDRLELIAKAFGCENWNLLSAKIEAPRPLGSARRVHEPTLTKTFCCSFCAKTQQEAKRLIAGPLPIFVCDECVERGPGRPLPYRASINSRSRSTWAAIWAASRSRAISTRVS
jgi:hypothetical protein